ncbi:Salivary proline-rich protein, related, related [Eimeria praecox]|uniref:Salivary proline-rich protein, related, related n=1 Tax=Eimeria praecox TaxID=51316 RepID=U6GLQ6_9EIME|nr:Salivary proline-rich protein, related, related [Eimeria praecox]
MKASSFLQKGDTCRSNLRTPLTEATQRQPPDIWDPITSGGPNEGPNVSVRKEGAPMRGPKVSVRKEGAPMRGPRVSVRKEGAPMRGPKVSVRKEGAPVRGSNGGPTASLSKDGAPSGGPKASLNKDGGPIGGPKASLGTGGAPSGGPLAWGLRGPLKGGGPPFGWNDGSGGIVSVKKGTVLGDMEGRETAEVSAEVRQELMRLLKETTSSFVSSTYSVHVQTQEREDLLNYLEGKEDRGDTKSIRGVSFAQQTIGKQVAPAATTGAAAAVAAAAAAAAAAAEAAAERTKASVSE